LIFPEAGYTHVTGPLPPYMKMVKLAFGDRRDKKAIPNNIKAESQRQQ